LNTSDGSSIAPIARPRRAVARARDHRAFGVTTTAHAAARDACEVAHDVVIARALFRPPRAVAH
jgi:hypothetical protein